ncbi:uncharacterized protein LOC108982606 [Juglans regia]|uniref:Uncharacterized protein LOC108982606 n=1 Tax=Juglans regia TaxID=51240 RepID=A0A6P9ECM7_JUGRE|nr:uncharacterized protein LOC108982606 [Juglans regia]
MLKLLGIYNKALMGTIAHRLVDLVWKNVLLLPENDFKNLVRGHSSFLFDAARSGNVEFLIVLIRSYLDLIWRVDEKNRSIFHLAIKYRQETVFNLIYELGSIKGIIALYTDQDKNNMLHLAAEIALPDRLNTISGAALQVQRELLWFKVELNNLSVAKFSRAEHGTARGSPVLSDLGFDLLNSLLAYDPKKRITAKAALKHDWFHEVPLPISNFNCNFSVWQP